MTPDDLTLICTCDGIAWWQQKRRAKTHTSMLFRGPVPEMGDLLLEVDEDDRVIARRLIVKDQQITTSAPFIMDTLKEGHGVWATGTLVERSMDGKPLRKVGK